jgi:hypothetical protein
MWNLHGGTAIGVATSATLSIIGGTYLHGAGLVALSILFLGVMFVSTLLAVATMVRFFRNQHRNDRYAEIKDARQAWVEAHARSCVFADTGM